MRWWSCREVAAVFWVWRCWTNCSPSYSTCCALGGCLGSTGRGWSWSRSRSHALCIHFRSTGSSLGTRFGLITWHNENVVCVGERIANDYCCTGFQWHDVPLALWETNLKEGRLLGTYGSNPVHRVAAIVLGIAWFVGGMFAPGFNGKLFLSVNECIFRAFYFKPHGASQSRSLRNFLSNPFLKPQAGTPMVGCTSVLHIIAPPLRSTLYCSLFVGAKKVWTKPKKF